MNSSLFVYLKLYRNYGYRSPFAIYWSISIINADAGA
jgi:hypothetical protein